MWPQTLQMTRDECRGILRRLELESYSHVISVFRAQGGLSEPKVKLLEELRSHFHISQERHRAEARRVANDEQLSSIAEAISGPNTWQEWSREGRRAYPLLPRVDPQTALTIIANDIAAKVRAENEKLPTPEETGVAAAEDEASYIAAPKAERDVHVVFDEPFKMPDIPAEAKKNLKRNNPDGHTTTASKKRHTQHQDSGVKHITANDSDIPTIMSESQIKKIEQQRFFHTQYQKHKQKMASKRASASASNQATASKTLSNKRQNAAGKSGRRAQKLLQRQLQQQQQQQHQQQQQQMLLQTQRASTAAHNNTAFGTNDTQQVDIIDDDLANQTYGKTKQVVHHLESAQPTSSTNNAKNEKPLISSPVQKYIVEDRPALSPAPLGAALVSYVAPNQQQLIPNQLPSSGMKMRTAILPAGTKLTPKKMNAHGPIIIDQAAIIDGTTINTNTIINSPKTSRTIAGSMRVMPFDQQQQQQQQPQHVANNSLGLPIVSGGMISTSPTTSNLKDKPAIISTTPVQKYVVEERQVALTGAVPTVTESPLSPKTILPPTPSVNATTLNIIKNIPASSLNNTLITPLTPTSSSTTATAVFRKTPTTNIIKALNVTTPTASTSFNTHTSVGSISTSPTAANNVSSGSTNSSPNTSGGPQIISNIKIAPATTQNTLPTTGQFNLKHVPANALRGSVKICQSPNGKVFLQPAHLSEATKAKLQSSFVQKFNATSVAGATLGGGNASSTSPSTTGQRIAIQKVQIISGPVISSAIGGSGTAKGTTLTIGGNKNNMIFLPASNMRPITISTKSGATSATLSSLVTKHTNQNQGDAAKPPNLVVIGPASTATTLTTAAVGVAGNTLTTKNNATVTIAAATSSSSPPSATPSTPTAKASSPSTAPTSTATSTTANVMNNNQLITEDTPVDIINMPFIVDDNNGAGNVSRDDDGGDGGARTNVTTDVDDADDDAVMQQASNNVTTTTAAESVTIINADNLIESEKTKLPSKGYTVLSPQQQKQLQQQPQSMLVLSATDWEMELDQATTNKPSSLQQQQQQQKANDFNNDIIIDESFEDVIEEEVEVADGDGDEEHITDEDSQGAEFESLAAQTKLTSSSKGDMSEDIEIDENTAVEYIDMDLEQPTTTTMTDGESDIVTTPATQLDVSALKATAVTSQLYETSDASNETMDLDRDLEMVTGMVSSDATAVAAAATTTTTTTIAQSNITQ